MATEYYCGTSGRVKAILVAPSSTTDTITFTGTPAALVEVTAWDINWTRDGGVPEVTTFESGADANYNIYPTKLRGGVARWSGSMQCVVDGDTSNSFEKLTPGCAFVADFIFQKGSGDGFIACPCVMSGLPIKTGVTEKAATFTVQFEGSGALPVPTI
jgi:hypothetical protein